MDSIWDRIEARADGPVLRARGIPTVDVLARLESGEAPDRLVATLGLDAADLIAVLTVAALGTGEDDGPPLVQSRPRRPALAPALTEEALGRLSPRAGRPQRLALVAGLNQIHDFWDASHEAAQQADDLGERTVSAYWHGIAHRREPDAGNASYWFRRVGRHPIFGPSGGRPARSSRRTARPPWPTVSCATGAGIRWPSSTCATAPAPARRRRGWPGGSRGRS
jgi:hypothetical protein